MSAGALRFRWDPLGPVLQDRRRAKVFPEGLHISQASLTSVAQVLTPVESVSLVNGFAIILDSPKQKMLPLAWFPSQTTQGLYESRGDWDEDCWQQPGSTFPQVKQDKHFLVHERSPMLPVMRWFCGLPYVWNFLILCCLTFVSNSHLLPLEDRLLIGCPWTSKAFCGSVNWDGRKWHLFDSLQLNFSISFSCACRRQAYRYYSTCHWEVQIFVTEKSRYLYIVLQLLKYHLCSPLTWSPLFAPRLQNIMVFLCVDTYMTKLVRLK